VLRDQRVGRDMEQYGIDPNPFVDDRPIEITPYVSLSLDIAAVGVATITVRVGSKSASTTIQMN
jgi:hypothetical protein